MSKKIRKWLDELGLGRYADHFSNQEVVIGDLAELDEGDLKELGIPLGPRKRILKAIALEEAGSLKAAAPANPPGLEENLPTWEKHPEERKPATILFADITGSTALTEHLDAEDSHNILDGVRQRICASVANRRGTVCRVTGDGVMALFGAPVASERHAVEACEAALEMQGAIQEYARDIEAQYGSELKIRVGLHSGEIVVLTGGEGDKVEYDADGPAVPIAARMEQSAEPRKVYITAATRSLAENRIETEAIEPISVKGISDPVPVFSLLRVSAAGEPPPYATGTPFVGRRSELNQFGGILEICLEEGLGQTIYVRGEPGIGKSRLVEEFMRTAHKKGASSHRGLVLPFGVGTGQDAIRSLVRSLIGIPPGSDKAVRQQAVKTVLRDSRIDSEQVVFLNDLLGLPQPMEQHSLYDAMDNSARSDGKQRVVSRLFETASETQPVLVVIEDVHWADSITLAHLSTLTKTVAGCPALLVMTSRIEGDQLDHSWRGGTDGSPFFTVDLGPLRKSEAVTLVSEFIDSDNPLAENCLERAAGNPLFLEQLLRNAQDGLDENLPDSIQTLVLARLDRLKSDDKRALQVASVIGQRFEMDVLDHLLETSGYNCRELIQHNLVRPEGPDYLFAHALIQEGVYGSLLKRQRQALHIKCAEWFSRSDAVLHAEHLELAGDPGAASAYLEAARQQARLYRYNTALTLAERGLSLAPQQSDRHRLNCNKAKLLLDLGEVESAMTVYLEVEKAAIDDKQIFESGMGIAACMRVMGNNREALALLEKCEPIAVKYDLTHELSRLHHLRGNLHFTLGNIRECLAEHQRALQHARKEDSAEDEARALGGLGDAEFARGRMKSAFDALHMCVEHCRKNGFGRIEVANLSQMTNCHIFLGDVEQGLRNSLESVQAAARVSHDRAEMNALAGVCGAAYALGDVVQLETSVERGMELSRKLKAHAWEPFWLGYQGVIYHFRGDRRLAQELLETAVQSESARPFIGAMLFGLLSMVTDESATRSRALEAGERLVQDGCMGECTLEFYFHAMEVGLQLEEWLEVERYAQALEDYTRAEPLPWSDYLIARSRALAAFGRGKRDKATVLEFQRLIEKAEHLHLKITIPALENALSQINT